jgi:alkylation response protein AidB-like acyl-CoA dehydrogenase
LLRLESKVQEKRSVFMAGKLITKVNMPERLMPKIHHDMMMSEET